MSKKAFSEVFANHQAGLRAGIGGQTVDLDSVGALQLDFKPKEIGIKLFGLHRKESSTFQLVFKSASERFCVRFRQEYSDKEVESRTVLVL